jgi:hypothetical protein
MTTPALIRRALLKLLAAYAPGSLPFDLLLDAINSDAPKPLKDVDLTEHLSWLKDQRMADSIGEQLDPAATRWLITRTGEAALKQWQ